MTGSQSEIKHAPERPGDVRHSLACVDKLHAAGFKSANKFDDGLNATVAFFQQKYANAAK